MLSSRFRDRPQMPTERAAFWVEHVIKHGGQYLRSPIHELTFVQRYLLDVIAFVAVIGLIFVYVMWKVVRMLGTYLAIMTEKKHRTQEQKEQ